MNTEAVATGSMSNRSHALVNNTNTETLARASKRKRSIQLCRGLCCKSDPVATASGSVFVDPPGLYLPLGRSLATRMNYGPEGQSN